MLNPMNDLVLLKDISASIEEKTKSGILLNAKGNPTPIYEVVSKGPTATDEVNVGDKVVLLKVTGQSISDTDGTQYYITRSDTILAVIED